MLIKIKAFVIVVLTLGAFSPLFAEYCIGIVSVREDRIGFEKERLETLLSELTLPATLLQDGRLIITTGRFATQSHAQRLLPLTQTRYPEAFVLTCNEAKPYDPIQGLEVRMSDTRSVSVKVQPSSFYAIEMMSLSLQEAKAREAEIEGKMANIPYAHKQVRQERFYLLGGRFETYEDAQIVLTLMLRRYPEAKIVSVEAHALQEKPTTMPLTAPKAELPEYQPWSGAQEVRRLEMPECSGLLPLPLKSEVMDGEQLFEGASSLRQIDNESRQEPFYGFYLRSNTAWDTLNNDAAYDIRLEWELFDQGYYHARKLQQKERLDEQIAIYRMWEQLRKLSIEQALGKIDAYRNAIDSYEIIERLKVQEYYLQQMQARYEARLVTQFEYDMLRFEIDKEKEMLRHFRNLKLMKMPGALWQLVNQIEYVRLRDAERILKQRSSHAMEQEHARFIAERSVMTSDWSDKLQLSLYAGQRKMYLSQHQSIVGVEAKIPLTFGDESPQQERVYYALMARQAKMEAQSRDEALSEMMSRFIYTQQRLMTLKNEIRRLGEHAAVMQRVSDLGYGALLEVGSDELYRIHLGLHTKHTAMQQERLALYSLLVEILFASQSSSISDLLEYALPDYADHREEHRSRPAAYR